MIYTITLLDWPPDRSPWAEGRRRLRDLGWVGGHVLPNAAGWHMSAHDPRYRQVWARSRITTNMNLDYLSPHLWPFHQVVGEIRKPDNLAFMAWKNEPTWRIRELPWVRDVREAAWEEANLEEISPDRR